MAKFDEILGALHGGYNPVDDKVGDDYKSNVIEINKQRQFIPLEFDTVVAYEGDINSQIVTFKLPRMHDAHDLSECDYKELKWKNLGSGLEGISKLKNTGTSSTTGLTDDYFCVSWEIPPEACFQYGALEISIELYDKSNGFVVFSWNTAKYSGLSIGRTLESVRFNFPAKDEILTIDKDTKQILSPAGYNNIVCNCGDIGVASLYLLISRYLGKNNNLDVFSEDTNIELILRTSSGEQDSFPISDKKLYTEELEDTNNEGMVFIGWDIPEEITTNALLISDFEIAVKITSENGGKKQVWNSNPYTKLKLGSTLGSIEVPEIIIDPIDKVYQVIESFFEAYDIIMDAND